MSNRPAECSLVKSGWRSYAIASIKLYGGDIIFSNLGRSFGWHLGQNFVVFVIASSSPGNLTTASLKKGCPPFADDAVVRYDMYLN